MCSKGQRFPLLPPRGGVIIHSGYCFGLVKSLWGIPKQFTSRHSSLLTGLELEVNTCQISRHWFKELCFCSVLTDRETELTSQVPDGISGSGSQEPVSTHQNFLLSCPLWPFVRVKQAYPFWKPFNPGAHVVVQWVKSLPLILVFHSGVCLDKKGVALLDNIFGFNDFK